VRLQLRDIDVQVSVLDDSGHAELTVLPRPRPALDLVEIDELHTESFGESRVPRAAKDTLHVEPYAGAVSHRNGRHATVSEHADERLDDDRVRDDRRPR